MKRHSKQFGFTIIELLVVLVVIGVLASITTVAFNNVQNRAHNSSRLAELKAWEKHLEMYYVANGAYPNVPDGEYCLGTGFPNGKCRDFQSTDPAYFYYEANAADLMTQLATVGSLPTGIKRPVDGTVGAYITMWKASDTSGYWISQVFHGEADECPSGTQFSWHNGGNMLICGLDNEH